MADHHAAAAFHPIQACQAAHLDGVRVEIGALEQTCSEAGLRLDLRRRACAPMYARRSFVTKPRLAEDPCLQAVDNHKLLHTTSPTSVHIVFVLTADMTS